MTTCYEAAVRYVHDLGVSVFPLPYRGKAPFPGWRWKVLQTRKPTDRELDAWFRGRVLNLAMVTGGVSGGLVVLDFDDLAGFDAWRSRYPVTTRMVTTGRGVHVYLKLTEPVRNGTLAVDGRRVGEIRGAGGYVVAPPSVHPTGKGYVWTGADELVRVSCSDVGLQTPPSNVLAVSESDRFAGLRREHHRPRSPVNIRHPRQYAEAGLRRECLTIAHAPVSLRNTTLFKTCLNVKRFLGVLSRDEIDHALRRAGRQSGLSEAEVTRTLDSAWNY